MIRIAINIAHNYKDHLYLSVFGWFQDSYTGVEQESPHVVTAGYWKGAQQVQRNLTFIINERIGRSTSEL